jgi:hypothetical protein
MTEDRQAMTVKFKMIESDIMQRFEGSWRLQPYSQRGLDRLYGKQAAFNPFGGFQGAPAACNN